MTDDSDAKAAADPDTDLAILARLAEAHPGLRPAIALNPATYQGLLDWLADLGDPDVDAALAQRRGAPPLASGVAAPAADAESEVEPKPEVEEKREPDRERQPDAPAPTTTSLEPLPHPSRSARPSRTEKTIGVVLISAIVVLAGIVTWGIISTSSNSENLADTGGETGTTGMDDAAPPPVYSPPAEEPSPQWSGNPTLIYTNTRLLSDGEATFTLRIHNVGIDTASTTQGAAAGTTDIETEMRGTIEIAPEDPASPPYFAINAVMHPVWTADSPVCQQTEDAADIGTVFDTSNLMSLTGYCYLPDLSLSMGNAGSTDQATEAEKSSSTVVSAPEQHQSEVASAIEAPDGAVVVVERDPETTSAWHLSTIDDLARQIDAARG